jgi:two-component system, LytTR family, sensor kinase
MNRTRLALLWLFYVGVCTAPFVANHPLPGSTVYSARGAIVVGVLCAVVWTFATVLILRLTRRLPFRRGQRLKVAGAHLGQFALCVVLNAIAFRAATTIATGTLPTGLSEGSTGWLGSIIMYSAITLVAFILDSRERAQAAELQLANANAVAAEARLHALRTQLQPHFLFNALNTVAMAVRRADRQEALAVVLDLSALLRTALKRTGTELVSLSEEVDFIKQYLEIEQIRFRDRLNIDWAIEPAAEDAAVPSMILQPLVENALRHGIGKKVRGGHVGIRIATASGRLNIAIEDDGPGFPAEWSPGVGLANVQNRLALHFGERARFETSSVGPGASVRMSIPYTRMNGNAEVHAADRR